MRTPEVKKWIVVVSVILLGMLQFPVLVDILPQALIDFKVNGITLTMMLGLAMFVSAFWVAKSETA
jgi:hypothetical protein